ncbi:MAG: hypothetical protein IJ496_11035 [Ruminococcus sp.]|nr:hypothetical protein [Ruminococcus sp.]
MQARKFIPIILSLLMLCNLFSLCILETHAVEAMTVSEAVAIQTETEDTAVSTSPTFTTTTTTTSSSFTTTTTTDPNAATATKPTTLSTTTTTTMTTTQVYPQQRTFKAVFCVFDSVTGEYIDGINMTLYERDEETEEKKGEIASWNTSDANPFVLDVELTLEDQYDDFQFIIKSDKLPDNYTFYRMDHIFINHGGAYADYYKGVISYDFMIDPPEATQTYPRGTVSNPTTTTTTTTAFPIEGSEPTTTTTTTTSPIEGSGSAVSTTTAISSSNVTTTPTVPVFTAQRTTLLVSVPETTHIEIKRNANTWVRCNEPVTWSSSDESILLVDNDGKVIPLDVGTAVLTALTSDGTTYSLEVVISDTIDSTGDVDLSGLIDISDATEALTIYAKTGAGLSAEDYTEEQRRNADADGDGVVEISDATAILTYYAQYAAGLEPTWEQILS